VPDHRVPDGDGRRTLTARARDTAGNVTVETGSYTAIAALTATSTPVSPGPTTPVATVTASQQPTSATTRPSRTPVAQQTTAQLTAIPVPTRPPRESDRCKDEKQALGPLPVKALLVA
jgi:hypothetical protein